MFLLQSAHVLFASNFTRLFSVWRFCSARSAAGLGRRDIVGEGGVRGPSSTIAEFGEEWCRSALLCCNRFGGCRSGRAIAGRGKGANGGGLEQHVWAILAVGVESPGSAGAGSHWRGSRRYSGPETAIRTSSKKIMVRAAVIDRRKEIVGLRERSRSCYDTLLSQAITNHFNQRITRGRIRG